METIEFIRETLEEKKGGDIRIFDVREMTAVADYFIICDGEADAQVRALANNVQGQLKKEKDLLPLHVEGMDALEWVLLDYGDIIIHIFSRERRQFYDLERLWRKAEEVRAK